MQRVGMNSLSSMLAALHAGEGSEADLLVLAREAARDPLLLQQLRDAWPADRWPIIGPYFCYGRLGQGSSGTVFRAVAIGEGRATPVAVKVLQFALPGEAERFRQREIGVLGRLRCRQVARYLDSGEMGGAAYLVMDLIRGRSLDVVLADEQTSIEEKLRLFRDVCRVLADIHAQGVIHRDLKPKHIIVDERGTPWLVDFGLSKVLHEDWPTRMRQTQTRLGQAVGTVRYMAPEQTWGGVKRVDHRTDLWSIGVMLFEAATGGDHPYNLEPLPDKTPEESLLFRIRSSPPARPRISGLPSGQSGALATLIERCLAIEPRHRMSSAARLAEDLDRILQARRIDTRGLPLRYRAERLLVGLAVHWRPGLWLGTVSGVVVLLLSLSLVFGVGHKGKRDDYGLGTRAALSALVGGGEARDAVRVIAVSDDALRKVPAWAAANGFDGVTTDIKSWRELHGYVMQRLASARPRVVAWDYYFRSAQPGDAAMGEGVRALSSAGVPVVLAIHRVPRDGNLPLSPTLVEALGASPRTGLILSRDQTLREGEILLALHRGDRVTMGLSVATLAAAAHPTCRASLDWKAGSEDAVRLVYQGGGARHVPDQPGGDDGSTRADAESRSWPALDRISLTTCHQTRLQQFGVLPGDYLGFKGFPMRGVEQWPTRTVDYFDVLTADGDTLRGWLAGRIVLIGDTRTRRTVFFPDRHDVRVGSQLLRDVPGVYFHAQAVADLLNGDWLDLYYPYGGAGVLAALGCLLSVRVARRLSRGGMLLLIVSACGTVAVAALVTLVATPLRSMPAILAACLSAALLLALAAGLMIERVRARIVAFDRPARGM